MGAGNGEMGRHPSCPWPSFSPPLGKETQFLDSLWVRGDHGTKQKAHTPSFRGAGLISRNTSTALQRGWPGWVSKILLGSLGDLKDGSHVLKREEQRAQS